MLIRRRKPPEPVWNTDLEGYKPAGCSPSWPFGKQRPVKSIAKPRMKRGS